MFCSKCGAEIKPGQKFCMKCGAPAGETQKVQKPKQERVSRENKPEKQKPEKKKRKPLWLGAGVAALAVVGVFVGGSLICDNRESVYAQSIENYGISDYASQVETLKSDFRDINFFNIFKKAQMVSAFSDLNKQSQKADAELTKQKKSIEEMENKKADYDLADSYTEYESSLNSCKEAIEKREYQNAVNAFTGAQDQLDKLVEDDKSYVKDKLDLYETADWSKADKKEKSTYEDGVKKINSLLDESKFGDMKTLFEQIDDIAFMYIEPENPLDVNVQQVDATDYPNVKLYVQFEDMAGNVPENLDANFFYVRKKDANANYVRQKVAQVTQLNELEALKIDMVADVSGSMEGDPLYEAQELMGEFIDTVQFGAGDQVELTSFSTGVYLQQEFTDDASILKNCINNLYTADMTSLYDALYTAVTRTAAQNGAKCVIAFTDGIDNNSNCSAQQVIDAANRYSVPVFIIGIGEVDSYDISNIANATGGAYYSIDDITSIREIYDQIYKQEKELYMIQYKDETGAGVSDLSKIMVGYHSQEYGGEENYAYTPKILMSVKGSTIYDDGPEAVVEAYMKNYADAMTESDFSYIEDYLKPGSNIYKTQKKYVEEKDFSLQLDSYEIADTNYKDSKHCVITTRETYYVQKTGEPLNLMTQQCKYKVAYVNGEWKMTDFDGNVKVLSRIKQ